MFLVFSQAINSPFPPSLSTVLLVLINSVTVTLFIIRRDATRVGNKVETAIALSGTFIVAFLHGPKAQDTHLLPSVIQIIALVGWAVSLMTLGRSFGIVAADRGLVQHGPYRFVRHPIYAFEALFLLGYLIAVPTLRSAIIITVWSVLQILRIVREERMLEGYEEYKQRVRWRIIPCIW
jgi:protein-S-isoprenylcysteine O-methyltransferase Ste14